METPVTQLYKFPALILGTECFTRDGATKIASDQYEVPADALSEAEKRYMDENATEFALLNGMVKTEKHDIVTLLDKVDIDFNPEDLKIVKSSEEAPPKPAPEPPSFDLHFTRNGVVTTVSIPNKDIHKLNPVHLYNFFHSQGIAAEISHAVEQK